MLEKYCAQPELWYALTQPLGTLRTAMGDENAMLPKVAGVVDSEQTSDSLVQ